MHKQDIKKISQKAKHLLNIKGVFILSDPERNPNLEKIFDNAPPNAIIIYRNYGDKIPPLKAKYKNRLLATIDGKTANKNRLYGLHIPNKFLKKHRISQSKTLFKTASAHNIKEVLKAKRCGIKNIIISPIFPSQSKSAVKIMGKIKFMNLIGQFPNTQFIALGGINGKTIPKLKDINLYGIAGISFN